MLNSIDKSMSLAEIMQHNSIDEVKETIIEKEIETVLRKSHTEQFVWLENKLSIPLRKDLNIWADFIELTERRNLFVHCDGIVNSQYLNVCKKNKVSFDTEVKIGDELIISPEYFKKAISCIFEMGVKLAQVLWRKLCPNDIDEADRILNEICYELILKEKYSLAINLLDFATSVIKKHASEENRLVFIVNKAQAYKWNGNAKKCVDIVNKIDWSAYKHEYQLASYVLLDDYKKAADIVRIIGTNGYIGKNEYLEWPLFKEFRKSKEFLKAYKDVFNEDFEDYKKSIESRVSMNAVINEAAVTCKEEN